MKIIVVGIRNSNKNAEPIFWFSPNIKNLEHKIRQIIAQISRTDVIG